MVSQVARLTASHDDFRIAATELGQITVLRVPRQA